ncbi:MAG: YARHG domain-containing protein [Bacillota bacterium]|nr:YARHG domain-containing protein [Bacillota bacterium]
MFCTKCGKEIDDSAKFCKYCGSPVEVDTEEPPETPPDIDTDIEASEEPVFQPKNRKKWVVPVCIAAGIAILGGVGVLAANMAKAEKETSKKVVEEKKEEQAAEPAEEKEPEVTYPKDITLDAEVQNKVTEFITLLGNVDCKLGGLNSERGEAYEGFAFLYTSAHTSVPFLNGNPAEVLYEGGYTWKIPEKDVVEYLKNSIGKTEYLIDQDKEYSNIVLEDNMVCLRGFDPNSMWTVETPVINKITAISDKDIEIQGSIVYDNIEGARTQNDISIVLTNNPKSMWGGYTLKSVNKWEEISYYVLPDTATRNYSEDELNALDEHGLYLARNEIYARHGYIFNNQDLKDYFGNMSWYTPTVTEVPDTDFNEFEKANLTLIQEKEEKLAQEKAEREREKEVNELYKEVQEKFAYTEQEIEYLEQANQFATYVKTEKLIINSVYTKNSKVYVDIELMGDPDTLVAYKINDRIVLAPDIENGEKTIGVRWFRSHSSEEEVFERVYVYKDTDGTLSCRRMEE